MDLSVRSILLAAVGSMATTYERAAAFIDEMVKKGELTVNEGREINQELRKRIRASASAPGSPSDGAGAVTRAEIDEIKERLSRLEQSKQ